MDSEHRRRLAGLTAQQRAALLRTLRGRRSGPVPSPTPSLPDTVVPIKPSGDRPALFCVHSVSGSALPYLPLGEHLDQDQPCYGLEAVGLHGAEPHRSAREMLDWQVSVIRQVQPRGPYHLTGWSTGGTLAFEIALALRRRLDPVGLLALLDTSPPPAEPVPVADLEALQLFATSVALTLGRRPLELDRQALSELGPEARVAATAQALADAGLVASHEVSQVRARARVAVALMGLAGTGPTGRHQGALHLLTAQQEPRAAAPDGWRRLASGPVTVHSVPGNHYTMLSPTGIPTVARTLQALLSAAD